MNLSTHTPIAITLAFSLGLTSVHARGNKGDFGPAAEEQLKKFPTYQTGFLSKEESLKSIEVPEGYELQLVLSEPHVEEPVAIAWDGNGVMYVCEMRTYMQDADATGEQEPRSRISRHEDTDGDGIYDKHSIYIDNLLLPRMILPLDDRVMIGVTNTLDLWTYRDTDNDGVADEKVKVYEGGNRGGNMEHQPSGLIWGLDNWIYITYESVRYRFTDGELVVEKIPRGNGQWGLTQDDDGRIYYSIAGRETAASGFQNPVHYGIPEAKKGAFTKDFEQIFPIAAVPDVQGGPNRVGPNGGVNHFTGVAGQEIFRGDSLPADVYGNLFIPEPVGRFIRRAEVARADGLTTLANATPGTEFIRTRDVNFRPVQTKTGPDGCLYIVDMHRGIIQQGNWTRPGSYLREVINRNGLDKNIGKGRIYRLVHKDHKPGPQPKLSGLGTSELVQHLSHRNGWWRDTAKMLIILRKDRSSVVPALEKIALDPGQSPQTRITALWTLEGCAAASEELLIKLLADAQPRVQTHAIRVSESLAKSNNPAIMAALAKLGDSKDPEVVVQLLHTALYLDTPEPLSAAMDSAIKQHANNPVVQHLTAWRSQRVAQKMKEQEERMKNAQLADTMQAGKETYQQLCFACHGENGKGQPLAGQKGKFLAPSFVGSKRVLGSGEAMIATILHGMEGPIDGKTYDGLMPAQETNTDQWVANVATYVRNSFGNQAPAITPDQVAKVRKKYEGRKTAWTQQELDEIEKLTGLKGKK